MLSLIRDAIWRLSRFVTCVRMTPIGVYREVTSITNVIKIVTMSSDVGPHPHAAENFYVILYWTACPREHAFGRCSFRGWRFKYSTRKCALSKVEVLN